MNITKKQLDLLKEHYPVGTRIELLQMDDVQAPPIGTQGTILGIDDTGSIIVHWDSGSSLNLLFNIDRFQKVIED
ncbi:DUF4314 domain-containing protein [Enterococcus olivae]